MLRLDRRRTLALGASALLAGCGGKLTTDAHSRPIDKARLAAAFPLLAARAQPGMLAMGVMNMANTEAWYSDTARPFPLAGAVALPIAAAALSQVETGQLSLTQRVEFRSLDLSPPPSIIDQRWPDPPDDRAATIQLAGLATLALQQGDTTAMDVLMKQVGGPGGVGAFLEAHKVTDLTVDRYQREIDAALLDMPTFRAAWKDPAAFAAAEGQVAPADRRAAAAAFIADRRDSATVGAAIGLLDLLAVGELLLPASTSQLLAWMSATASPFRPGLPDKARLARAGGATPSDQGVTAATSELAIVSFADNRQYALAAFLIGSTLADADRAGLFADVARLASQAVGAGD